MIFLKVWTGLAPPMSIKNSIFLLESAKYEHFQSVAVTEVSVVVWRKDTWQEVARVPYWSEVRSSKYNWQ